MLFVAGAVDWAIAAFQHRPWHFAVANPTLIRMCLTSSLLQCVRLTTRMYFTGRVYGPWMAAGVPFRQLHGNIINCCASLNALWRFTHSYLKRRPLHWLKTDHSYPNPSAALPPQARTLADVLLREGYLAAQTLASLREEMRSDEFLAELLLLRGLIPEQKLCHALSLKHAVPLVTIAPSECRKAVTRTFPLRVGQRFGIIPYRVKEGRLLVAGTGVPEGNWQAELGSWTRLPIEFQLVTKGTFEQLTALSES